MNKVLLNIMLAGILLAASACSMPETKIYSLHIKPEAAGSARKQAMITLRVQSPRYLSQPYVAHRISPYQLDISRYSKWDSAPVDMVRDIFRDSLSDVYQDVRVSNFAVEGSHVLVINLKRFERVEEGYAELMFDAVLSSAEGKEIQRFEVHKKVQIETKDPAGLAKGLSSAMSESVKEVVAGVSSRI